MPSYLLRILKISIKFKKTLDKLTCLCYNIISEFICRSGGMADAVDSKSTGSDIVRVQVPSPAPLTSKFYSSIIKRKNVSTT